MSSSKLSVGIIGLPNAGKSTLFNALASRRLAETAERPFTTIDPHEAVVAVHDEKFHRLVDLVKPEKSIPATVAFIDIAGLIKGAHKGEGLGNQFLGKIREVDAIVHVVRSFKNEKVTHVHTSHKPGSNEQILEDIEIVNLELELGEIGKKPTLYVLNVNEEGLNNKSVDKLIKLIRKKFKGEVMAVAAKTEEDMIELDNIEKEEMFKLLEWERSALDRLVLSAYKLLDLISFYTIKGGKETTAWSLKRGSNALEAAEKVHTDFAKKFIKAEVVNVDKLFDANGWKEAKEKGLIRLEGKDYIVQEGDVVEFKIGS
jgi:small GTP-binding protein